MSAAFGAGADVLDEGGGLSASCAARAAKVVRVVLQITYLLGKVF